MAYTPKTEDQLAKEGLMPNGVYDAEVVETSDKQSKKGNDMFTLKLRVFNDDGSSRFIYDYIVMGTNFGERKLRHAADACGLIDTYNAGSLTAGDFLNTSCKVEVAQQNGTPAYPTPKNIVSDYISREEAGFIKADAVKKVAEIDDGADIPF